MSEGEGVNMPELREATHRQYAGRQCQNAHRRLRHHQKPTLVKMIGGEPRPGQKEHLRSEL